MFEMGDDKMLAVCDTDILGKTFADGDITITVNRDFYHEKECTREAVLKMAKKSTIINAVGNETISLLIKERIVDKSSVLKIGKVSHAQVVTIP